MDARTERRWLRSATVIGAGIGALLVSVAFATWLANGEGSGQAQAGTAQDLVVSSATAGEALFPGTSGDVGLTITNPNPYPVLVTLVEQVPDSDITSDTEGCDPSNHEVAFTTQSTSIHVPADDSTSANLVGAATMGLGSADACQGAVFTIPLRVTGGVDDGSGGSLTTFYADSDGDGYGDPDTSTQAASAPPGYVGDDNDCDDGDAAVNPAAVEIANGIDDDCDAVVDEGTLFTFYVDNDDDGYGDPASSVEAAGPPAGYVIDGSDCDDSDASTYPGANEVVGDGVDHDCDGSYLFYLDGDLDGYGSTALGQSFVPTGDPDHSTTSDDCDDSNPAINPGATEEANLLDDDCDGVIDEDFPDFDADGLVDEIDADDDNDGVLDVDDPEPLNPAVP